MGIEKSQKRKEREEGGNRIDVLKIGYKDPRNCQKTIDE